MMMALQWLREIRRKMAKEFNYDPKKAGDYYRQMARRPGVKLYKREDRLTAVKRVRVARGSLSERPFKAPPKPSPKSRK